MSTGESFTDAVARLQEGDEQAAADVFARFADQLIRLARTRLDARLRKTTDPEDVMQSVWRSFFVRQQKGRFEIENWDALWAVLVVMTVRKCARRAEIMRAAKRDVGREVSDPTDSQGKFAFQVADSKPTPEQAAILTELIELMMEGLDEREQNILTLRLQGYTFEEIGAQVGRTERTVRRVVSRLRERAAQLEQNPV